MKLELWRDAIAVHQMGKVGSTTVWYTLREALPRMSVYHTHLLNREDVYRNIRNGIDADKLVPEHVLESFKLVQWRMARPNSKLHVISLVRDPVARSISSFFQNLKSHWITFLPDSQRSLLSEWLARPKEEYQSDLPESLLEVCATLQTLHLERFHPTYGMGWTQRQLHEALGINIYGTPFAKEKGYQAYSFDRIRVLFLEMERLDEIMIPALCSFFELENLTSKKGNIGSEKEYSALYAEFLRTVAFPSALLDQAYGSDFVRYFYTPERIKEFRARWKTA